MTKQRGIGFSYEGLTIHSIIPWIYLYVYSAVRQMTLNLKLEHNIR
jgi:hypothetical protein